MSESNNTKVNRRDLSNIGLGAALGLAMKAIVPEARATPGAEDAALAAILKQLKDTYDYAKDQAKVFESYKDMVKDGIDKSLTWMDELWAVSDTMNKLMNLGTDMGFSITNLPREFEAFFKMRVAEMDDLLESYKRISKGERNNSFLASHRARMKASRTLGELAAKNVRKKYFELAQKSNSLRAFRTSKSRAEMFSAAAAPLQLEQNQLILESMIRQETTLDRILEALGKVEQMEPEKPFDKKDFERAYKNWKQGKGTLIDGGDEA